MCLPSLVRRSFTTIWDARGGCRVTREIYQDLDQVVHPCDSSPQIRCADPVTRLHISIFDSNVYRCYRKTIWSGQWKLK